MSCHDFHKTIHRLLDGEIDEGEKRGLEEHLEGCKDCARFLEDQRLLKSLFRPETVAPPETLRKRILTALEAVKREGAAGGRKEAAPFQEGARVILLFRRAALAALLFLAVTAALFFSGLGPLIAENRESEIHYEDLFSIAPPEALLDVLVRTQSPSEAMRLAAAAKGAGSVKEPQGATEDRSGTKETSSPSSDPPGSAHERKGGKR